MHLIGKGVHYKLTMEALGNLALDRGRRYVNLDDNLWSVETKLRRLVGRKSDLELQVTDEERSGTKKRKREVEIWFEEVATVENEFGALKTSIQEGGFLENAISSGDRVAKMDAIVEQLMEQSNHFDGLLLEAFESRGEPRVTTKLFGEMFDRGLKQSGRGWSSIASQTLGFTGWAVWVRLHWRNTSIIISLRELNSRFIGFLSLKNSASKGCKMTLLNA